ncbi:hypothetical protein FQP81_18155 [Pseudoalteromonas distincta]|uniref:hypothetical protein n=1 Tax=Pseudoalteromonas distincta TaxID=77608 RepID=UPI001194678F|nr:hypothetical protein [Pseudoalteromonas elyakovii]TVU70379.1 hypothetical protein FQP81_18155 [Pseudoalteromonas elyakovii]
MRLGNLKYLFNKRKVTLDEAPLKKIIGVSDDYWLELYKPAINVVVRTIDLFDNDKNKLYEAFSNNFINLIRRNKGGVLEDSLLLHIQNYSLALSICCLFVARLCQPFEFHSISLNKKTNRERNRFYPWLNIPENCELKIRKSDYIYPLQIYTMPIMASSINTVGFNWLHSRPKNLKNLIDALYSNGEIGELSALLCLMDANPLNIKVDSKDLFSSEPSDDSTSENPKEQPKDTNVDIDSLLNSMGAGDSVQKSFDEILNSGISNNNTKADELDKSVIPGANENSGAPQDLDFSIFGNTENNSDDLELTPTISADASNLPITEVVDSPSVDPLSEFTNYLQDSTDINNEYSVSGCISDDFILWCISISKREDREVLGIFVINIDGNKVIAFNKDLSLMAFVKSDYELEKEVEYIAVAEEIFKDIKMNDFLVKDCKQNYERKLNVQGSDINVFILSNTLDVNCKLTENAVLS